jgi:hypothetical protein
MKWNKQTCFCIHLCTVPYYGTWSDHSMHPKCQTAAASSWLQQPLVHPDVNFSCLQLAAAAAGADVSESRMSSAASSCLQPAAAAAGQTVALTAFGGIICVAGAMVNPAISLLFLWFNWGSAIVLADHTRFSWANPTAGSLRHCLTSKTRHAPNTRRCPAPGPKTSHCLSTHLNLTACQLDRGPRAISLRVNSS